MERHFNSKLIRPLRTLRPKQICRMNIKQDEDRTQICHVPAAKCTLQLYFQHIRLSKVASKAFFQLRIMKMYI